MGDWTKLTRRGRICLKMTNTGRDEDGFGIRGYGSEYRVQYFSACGSVICTDVCVGKAGRLGRGWLQNKLFLVSLD